jgi:hypothetical protein
MQFCLVFFLVFSSPASNVSVKNTLLVFCSIQVVPSHSPIIQYAFAFPVIFLSDSNCQIVVYVTALECAHITIGVCGVRLPASSRCY